MMNLGNNSYPKLLQVAAGAREESPEYVQRGAFPPQFVDARPAGKRSSYWIAIRRSWLAVAVLGIAGAAAGIGLSELQTPAFRARASLEIDTPPPIVAPQTESELFPAAPGGADLATQIKILESRALIERVVDRLHLERDPHFVSRSAVVERLRGLAGKPLPPLTPAQSRERAILISAANLKVRPAGQTSIVEVLFDAATPELAAGFVNTLSEEFADRDFELRSSSNKSTAKWLKAQIADLKNKLESSEVQLQQYARSADIVFTSANGNAAEEKLREIQQEFSRAQADRAVKESQYEMAAASPPESLPAVLDSEAMHSYQERLSELRSQYADLNTALTPENPKVKRLQAQIAEVQGSLDRQRDNLVRRIQNEAGASRRREAIIAAAFNTQSKQVSDVAFRSIRYDMLKHEVDTNRQIYESMLQKVKGANISSAMRSSNIQTIDTAKAPSAPFSPDVPLNTALGLLCGLFGGVATALLRETNDRTIKGRGATVSIVAAPELGVIPAAAPRRFKLPGGPLRMLEPAGSIRLLEDGLPLSAAGRERIETISWESNSSAGADAFRATLTSILFHGLRGQGHPQVIVVTSPLPGEGKTTVASNLAIAAAGMMDKVLIIDADHRLPRLHEIFNVPNSWGLSELLRERTPLESAPAEALARPTHIPQLYVLPSGGSALNFCALLHSDRMAGLMRRLRREFSMIIIDTPPTLILPDARVVARHSDGVVLVVREGQTLGNNAAEAANKLREDSTPILGSVLNGWDKKHDFDGYGYYEGAYPRA